MSVFKKLITYVVAFVLIAALVIIPTSSNATLKSSIIGYGPIESNVLFPSASCYQNGLVYTLDTYGICIAQKDDRSIVKRFPVQNPVNMLGEIDFLEYLTSFNEEGSLEGILAPLLALSGTMLDGIVPSIGITSKEECVIAQQNSELGVYDTKTGSLLTTIKIDPVIPEVENTCSISQFAVKNDIIYTFSVVEEELEESDEEEFEPEEAPIFRVLLTTMKTTGEVIEETDVTPLFGFLSDLTYLNPRSTISGFSISPDGTLFSAIHQTMDGQFIIVFNQESILIKESIPEGIMVSTVDFYSNEMLYLGVTVQGFLDFEPCQINCMKIKNENDSYSLMKEKEIKFDDTGLSMNRILCNDAVSCFVCSGEFKDLFNYKTFIVENDKGAEFLSTPNGKGQIRGSAAFAVDSNQNLYETGLGNGYINVFDNTGEYKKQIPFNFSEVSSLMGMIDLFPFITDMEIEGEYLYISNSLLMILPSVSRYSLETEEWEKVFEGDMLEDGLTPIISLEIYDEEVYSLHLGTQKDKSCIINHIDLFGELEQLNFTFESSDYDPSLTPLWIDFQYDTEEELFYILDGLNNTMLVFDSDEDLQYVVPLRIPPAESPSEESSEDLEPVSLFSSFELCEDTIIVTDVIANKLYTFSLDGSYISSYGKMGSPPMVKTQEDYQKNPDSFNGLWKVRMAKEHTMKTDPIYISDFGNCRYHKVFQFTPPTIEYPKQAYTYSDFSVFSNETHEIEYSITPENTTCSFVMKSNVPWIEFPAPEGVLPTDALSFAINGSKLECWENNVGDILIEYPDYPSNNQQFHIEVQAIGNTVVLQIGSNIATINNKEVSLDAGSIPIISSGRTYVAIRFLSEQVFQAQVEWNGEERSVTFTTNNATVKVFIGKNEALVNGKEVTLDAPPIIVEGRTLVPLRFVSENLGASVGWDGETQSVTIRYPGSK